MSALTVKMQPHVMVKEPAKMMVPAFVMLDMVGLIAHVKMQPHVLVKEPAKMMVPVSVMLDMVELIVQ